MRSLCWCSAALAPARGLRVEDRPCARPVRLRPGRPLAVHDAGRRALRPEGRRARRHFRGRTARQCVPRRAAKPRPPSSRPLPARQRRQPRGPAAAGDRARVARRRDDDDLAAERRVVVPPAGRQRAARARPAGRAPRTSTARELGLVGFSLGAQTAAILAGDEPRLKAVGILVRARRAGARVYWLRQAHGAALPPGGTVGRRRSAAPASCG